MSAGTAAAPKPGSRSMTIVPVVLVGIVLLMVIPLSPFILDFLLAISLSLSVALLLASIHSEKPLDLSVFPTVLLFVTLLRLALNVASTRLILLHGSDGAAAAGDVIRAFGEFLIGGNYLVGATVFLLLVIINFVVITKGAGRVAEVSARFNLDAMPGKQMSIDADLGAGVITQEQAQTQRRALSQESDFFGAMDGASKFVRGDAIAGLLMTGINIVVGFVVGVVQQGLSAGEAAETYMILTVGDGLASQIPALLVSTAAGVVVTRAAAGAALGPALVRQLGARKTTLFTAAGIVGAIGLLPGMPIIPFFALAAALGYAGRIASDTQADNDRDAEKGAHGDDEPTTERDKLVDALTVDLLELEVGLDLIPLVDAARGGELVERIAAIRKKLAADLGVLIPPAQIRDNLRLESGGYQLLISGQPVGHGAVRVNGFLAMDPTGTLPPVDGESVREPAFGLPARWIPQRERERAEMLGYTVVDAATVAATHITELLRSVAPELLGRTEAQELVDVLGRREPRLVDELIPNVLSLGDVIQVLRNLLREQVSIRDLRTIFEALADHGRATKDSNELTELVRLRLSRAITARFQDEGEQVAALVLDPRAEDSFRNGGPDAGSAQRVLTSLDRAAASFAGVPTPPVVVCAQDVRRSVSEFFRRRVPGLSVVSYGELSSNANIKTLGIVTS